MAWLMDMIGGYINPYYTGGLQFVNADGTPVGPPGMGVMEAMWSNPSYPWRQETPGLLGYAS